jgi:plasmid stability protein
MGSMAALRLTNIPDALYRKLQKRAHLHRRSLVQEVTRILSDAVEVKGGATYSILELEGLGKELWKGIDSDQYIDAERNSWD